MSEIFSLDVSDGDVLIVSMKEYTHRGGMEATERQLRDVFESLGVKVVVLPRHRAVDLTFVTRHKISGRPDYVVDDVNENELDEEILKKPERKWFDAAKKK